MRSLSKDEERFLWVQVSNGPDYILDDSEYDDAVIARLVARGLLSVSHDDDWTHFSITPLGRTVLNAVRVLR